MQVIELKFSDDERRLAARPAHRELLNQLRSEGLLVMAGPWEDDSGSLLIFDTDKAGVDKIIADDPYYQTPGVEVASVRPWQPIVSR